MANKATTKPALDKPKTAKAVTASRSKTNRLRRRHDWLIPILLFAGFLVSMTTFLIWTAITGCPRCNSTDTVPLNAEPVAPAGQLTDPAGTPTCPLKPGQTSNNPVLVNAAIEKLKLPPVPGKPYPVTNATELNQYFSITTRKPSDWEVDWDCTTLQLPPIPRITPGSGSYEPFSACNPLNIKFDGFKHAWQYNGVTVTGQSQIGFDPGRWDMEGISLFYKGPYTVNCLCCP